MAVDPMVELRYIHQVEHAAGGPGLWVSGSVDDSRQAGQDDRAGAHRTRLEGHVHDGVENAPAAQRRRRLAKRQHLGVGRRVGAQLALVVSRADNLPAPSHDRANGNIIVLECPFCLAQSEPHEVFLTREEPFAHQLPHFPE